MMTLPVKKMLKVLYPSLIRLDEYLLKASAQVNDFKNLEKRLPLAAENLDSRGLYLYDDGFRFNIWFGRALSPDVAMKFFGADFAAELSKVTLSERDNEMSRKLVRILENLEKVFLHIIMCHLVRQGEQPREDRRLSFFSPILLRTRWGVLMVI
ncbi:protein transport protein SEC24 A-like [Castanea sativa]|uniref:protein transport protein SEC24 A-like n=1 Tax=Castanea sativa TaxID=21020 RepID=UPI003F64AD93